MNISVSTKTKSLNRCHSVQTLVFLNTSDRTKFYSCYQNKDILDWQHHRSNTKVLGLVQGE